MTTNHMVSNQDSEDTVTRGSILNGLIRANYTNDVTTSANGSLQLTHELFGGSSTYQQSIPLSLLQWIVFLLGTVGNLFVLLVLLWRRNVSHLVTQLFVGSMCVANMAMMFGVAWIQAILHNDQRWKFGIVLCKVFYFLYGTTIGCSTWTLAVIAVDR